MLDLPRKALSRHYLITVVTGEAWKKSAEELTTRYGIEVLDFNAAKSHTAVFEFFSELAQKVEETRAGRKADLVNS